MKKIAIVTVNYNTEEDTHALLNSLELMDKRDLGIKTIVIDNGSDKSFKLLESERKSDVILIRSDANKGFTGGYNMGIKEALKSDAEYVLILNNDTTVYPDMIKNLLIAFEKDSKIGITVPKIYFAKGHEFHKNRYKNSELGRVFWFAGGETDWRNVKSIHRGVDEVDHGQYNKTEETGFATGCCIMFKREVLEKVGLFDERYFLYYEDADLNERIKRAGYKIYYAPAAVLIHINAASSGGAGNILQDYFITRNRMLFGLTYAPFRTKLALIRESLKLIFSGRPYQKRGIIDYYLQKFNKGTFFDNKPS